MKSETRFVALDDREFKTQKECEAYERKLAAIADAMSPLGRIHPDMDNGAGYIQHTKEACVTALNAILDLLPRGAALDRHVEAVRDWNKHPGGSFVGRYLSDGDKDPLYPAWTRLMCVDSEWREWDQPYFAMNPGKLVRLNP